MAKKFKHLLKLNFINDKKDLSHKQTYAKALLEKRKPNQEKKENTEWQ
jgi:hypothetical protein